jgi:hypothetical protein
MARRIPALSTLPAVLDSWFLVQITQVISASANQYAFVEVQLEPDGNYEVKQGGRYGTALNPGIPITSTLLAVGSIVLAQAAGGASGEFHLLPVVGVNPTGTGAPADTPDQIDSGQVPALNQSGNLAPSNFVVTNNPVGPVPATQYTLTPPGPISPTNPVIQFQLTQPTDGTTNPVVQFAMWNNLIQKLGWVRQLVLDPVTDLPVALIDQYTFANPTNPTGPPITSIQQFVAQPDGTIQAVTSPNITQSQTSPTGQISPVQGSGPAPGAPLGVVAAVVNNATATIAWTPPASIPPAAQYVIQTANNPSMLSASTYATTIGTSITVAPLPNDVTTYIGVYAVAQNGATSGYANILPVTPNAGPVIVVPPTITGTPTQGQTLTVSTGTWTGSGLAYIYQWVRAGNAIAGATASTYVLTGGDIGSTISASVTATNANNQSNTASSAPVGPVLAAPAETSTTIQSSGTSLVVAFNRAVNGFTAGSANGFTLTGLSGGATTPTYSSGNGTSSITFTISRTVTSGETGGALAYTPGSIVGTADSVALPSFSGASVTNNSTQAAAPPNPTAYWNFDSASGNDNCSSPCNLSTSQGTVASVTGIINTAAHFASATSGLKNSAPGTKMNPGSGTWSLAGWVNLDSVTTGRNVFSTGAVTGIAIQTAGTTPIVWAGFSQQSSQSGQTVNSNVAVNSGVWVFIALTFDGSNLNISVNGGAFVSVAASAPAATSAVAAGDSNSNSIVGAVDEWGWWKGHALTTGEVQYLYNGGAGHTFNGTSWV